MQRSQNLLKYPIWVPARPPYSARQEGRFVRIRLKIVKMNKKILVGFNSLIIIGLLFFINHGIQNWQSSNPYDYYQFWVVGQAVRSMELDNIYSLSDRIKISREFQNRAQQSASDLLKRGAKTREILEPGGTPFLYAVFYLASMGSYDFDYKVFRLVSLYFYIGSIVALAVILKFPIWSLALVTIFFTQSFWPFQIDFEFGNVGQLQVGCLTLFLLCQKIEGRFSHFIGGFIIGLLVLFKPTLIFCILLLSIFWLFKGRKKKLFIEFAGIGIALTGGFILPRLLFGNTCTWQSWYETYPSILYTNFFLTGGFLGKLLNLKSVPLYGLFGAILFLLTALFLFWIKLVQKTPNRREVSSSKGQLHFWIDEYSVVMLGIGIYLLSGPIVHSHYFLLAVPWALLLLRPRHLPPFSHYSRYFYWMVFLACIFIALHPIFKKLNLTNYPNHSLWSFGGIWIFYGLTLMEYYKRKVGGIYRMDV